MINLTSSSELSHFPVMMEEVIKICSPSEGGVYVDCTFGGGGYSKQLRKFSKTKVIALDRDRFVINISKEYVIICPTRFYRYNVLCFLQKISAPWTIFLNWKPI